MPTTSIHFTPSRRKKNGITSMNRTSDIWPMVIFPAAFTTPFSFRKRFVNP